MNRGLESEREKDTNSKYETLKRKRGDFTRDAWTLKGQ
jgi:hypothetical protein